MTRAPIICLRVIQGLMASANIGLVAYIINWHLQNPRFSTPSSISFLLFAPIFSLLSILYIELGQKYTPGLTHPVALLSSEALNAIFYFSGFIAVALGLSELSFCHGPVCMAGRGVAVLAAAQFSVWMGSAILVAKEMFRCGKLMRSRRGQGPQQQQRGMVQV